MPPAVRTMPGVAERLRALRPARWPRDTRDTLFQLAVIGWTVLPHLRQLPLWCGALTAAVLVWRAWLALSGRALPGRWTLIAVLALAIALTAWSERSLLGRDAGLTMLVVLMGLKTLELRARRDAMVVFFLGFFLVLTQCLHSQSLATALAMVVSAWGLLTALVLSNMPVGRPRIAHAAALAARSALLGLPLMAALFLLFPRIGPMWGLPQDAVGRTGLSGTLRLGGVASVANDDSIAFRIRFDGEAPPPSALYFRGPVLSRFDGLEWQQAYGTRLQPSPAARAALATSLRTAGAPVGYEVLFEPIRLPLLPLLEATPDLPGAAPVLAEGQAWLGADLLWHSDRLLAERLRLRGQAWPRWTLDASAPPGQWAALRLLPPGYNPRMVGWAVALRAQLGAVDARTLANAVLAHIRQQRFVYTLQPGSYGRDAVDEFWFDRQQGFCEHYAVAFVVAMRAMAVPARLVTGYQGAEPPDEDGFRVVRQSHAHAWAEYWQPGDGWLRADPTAAATPERVRSSRALPVAPGLVGNALRTMNPALAERLRRAWELADSRWTQWVMGWSSQRQLDLLRTLGVGAPDWTDLLRALVGVLATGALALALWAWHDRRRQDPWQRLYGRVCAALRATGIAAQPSDGPRTLAERVRARHGERGTALAQVLEDLDRSRYGRQSQRLPPRGWWARLSAEAGLLVRGER